MRWRQIQRSFGLHCAQVENSNRRGGVCGKRGGRDELESLGGKVPGVWHCGGGLFVFFRWVGANEEDQKKRDKTAHLFACQQIATQFGEEMKPVIMDHTGTHPTWCVGRSGSMHPAVIPMRDHSDQKKLDAACAKAGYAKAPQVVRQVLFCSTNFGGTAAIWDPLYGPSPWETENTGSK